MTLRTRLIEVLSAEVGVHEEGGNNRGARVQEYMRATWMAPADIEKGFAWCAAFICFGLRAALIREGVQPKLTDAWRCRDASAFGFIKWAQQANGCVVLPGNAAPGPGDLVVFDFNGPLVDGGGHIAAVERDLPGDQFATIEGNTNDAGARDSNAGDGVLRKSRGTRTVINFIRLPDFMP